MVTKKMTGVSGVLLWDNMLMGAFHFCIITYTDLLTRVYSRLATGLPCLCPLRKMRHCLWVSLFLNALFSWMFRAWLFNPARSKTGMEETYWSLTSFLFKVGVINSVLLQNTEKNLRSVHPCKSTIPFLIKQPENLYV